MREVTKNRFYEAIGPRNVCPRSERMQTIWIDQSTHKEVGRSEPGYSYPGAPKRYWLTPELAPPSPGEQS